MDISLFDFELSEELIAQTPLKNREDSRLMVLHPNEGQIDHRHFYDLVDYFNPGDTLVLNDTKVLPARLLGVKSDTGAKVEILLLKRLEGDKWECLVKPAKRINVDTVVDFGDGKLRAHCVQTADEGRRYFRFEYEGIFNEILDELGNMPLPPYIREQLEDRDRYQTVFAKHEGSAAAPTAGLHFTEDLLQKLRDRGIYIVFVTLHVGMGTFRPVKTDTVEDHQMHAEFYRMTDEVADQINRSRQEGNRVIAVGTTVIRTLETIAAKYNGHFQGSSGWTDIFIYPGYHYQGVDGFITNFHLPKSTLIMLVSAFAGHEFLMFAYREAVKERYRFFSFGDAMLVLERNKRNGSSSNL